MNKKHNVAALIEINSSERRLRKSELINRYYQMMVSATKKIRYRKECRVLVELLLT